MKHIREVFILKTNIMKMQIIIDYTCNNFFYRIEPLHENRIDPSIFNIPFLLFKRNFTQMLDKYTDQYFKL